MPRKEKVEDVKYWHGKGLISLGLLLIVAGLVYYLYPERWDYVLMVSGLLVLLKGLAIKLMKK